jgi:hypothetical protein
VQAREVIITRTLVCERERGESLTSSPKSWRRNALRRAIVPLLIAVAGVVLVVAGGAVVEIVGWGVLGIALTVTISLAFLEVGYSEDRARAGERSREGEPARRRRAPIKRRGPTPRGPSTGADG